MRLEDSSAVVREAFPAEYVDLALFVSAFGDAAALTIVLACLYWLGRRRETALVLGYAVAGVGCILLLKSLFGLPRPPESVRLVAVEGSADGFPSGHAFAATVVFGGLVVAYDRLRDPRAVAAAGTAIAAVSLSRVVLGVHYLGDVVAGVVVGVAFLAVVRRLVAGDPRRGFALGAGLAVPAVVATGGDPDSLIALGAGVGGALAAGRLEELPPLRTRLEAAVVSVAGGVVVAAGFVLESVASALAPAVAAGVGVVLVNAGLFAGILLCPAAAGLLESGSTPDRETASSD